MFSLPAQDHGIRHIRTLKLVETQDIAVFGNICCNKRDRIDIVSVLHLHAMQPPVYVLHEIVEMYSCFGPNSIGERVVEKVHEHSLATTDIAKQI